MPGKKLLQLEKQSLSSLINVPTNLCGLEWAAKTDINWWSVVSLEFKN